MRNINVWFMLDTPATWIIVECTRIQFYFCPPPSSLCNSSVCMRNRVPLSFFFNAILQLSFYRKSRKHKNTPGPRAREWIQLLPELFLQFSRSVFFDCMADNFYDYILMTNVTMVKLAT